MSSATRLEQLASIVDCRATRPSDRKCGLNSLDRDAPKRGPNRASPSKTIIRPTANALVGRGSQTHWPHAAARCEPGQAASGLINMISGPQTVRNNGTNQRTRSNPKLRSPPKAKAFLSRQSLGVCALDTRLGSARLELSSGLRFGPFEAFEYANGLRASS